MHISAKCSVALHCLLLLSEFGEEKKITSEVLGRSTGCNPVTIRSLLGALKRSGLVQVARGVGGARLARAPEDITVLDVYAALDPEGRTPMIALHPNPSPQCPVGRRIRPVLEGAYSRIEDAVRGEMGRMTLAQIQARYRALRQARREQAT